MLPRGTEGIIADSKIRRHDRLPVQIFQGIVYGVDIDKERATRIGYAIDKPHITHIRRRRLEFFGIVAPLCDEIAIGRIGGREEERHRDILRSKLGKGNELEPAITRNLSK